MQVLVTLNELLTLRRIKSQISVGKTYADFYAFHICPLGDVKAFEVTIPIRQC